MMGHGKHCSCMMCSAGKSLGVVEKCSDKNCENPAHKEEHNEKEDKNKVG